MSINWQLDKKVIQGTSIADMGRATQSLKSISQENPLVRVEGFDTISGYDCNAFNGMVATSLPVYVFKYDFATDGGAIGLVTLRGTGKLAVANAIINAYMFVNTALTSGGAAAVSVGCANSAVNLLAATAIATMGSAGGKALIPILATPSTHIDTGATEFDVTITISAAALTAGRFTLVLFGVPYATDTGV